MSFTPIKSGACGLRFTKPTKCQTHLSKMCDINNMIQRAIAGDSSVYRRGSYGDFRDAPEDMQGYLNLMVRGREAYEALPSAVKAVYPSSEVFLSALGNPDERERLVNLGVLVENKPAEPIAVKVIPAGNEPSKGEAQSVTT